MRSLKYAEDVINGKRIVPKEVVSAAKRFKMTIDKYYNNGYSCSNKLTLIENIIDYDICYMTEDREPCDAIVFATAVLLLHDNSLFVVPRKNGKTSTIVHMIRFFHIYYDELNVGIFGSHEVICNIVASEMKRVFYNEDILCVQQGDMIRIKGKNNKYILISDNNPQARGQMVDILLVDEFLELSDSKLNNIHYKQIKATSSIYSHDDALDVNMIINSSMFDFCLLYTTPVKDYYEITVDDMVRCNPLFEHDVFYDNKDRWFERSLIRNYEKNKYFADHQSHFLTKHLNMIDI